MSDLMTLMGSIVKCYNAYAGKDGDASSMTMREMHELFMKELQPWVMSLSDRTEVDAIIASFCDDISPVVDFTKFGKLLIDFANVMQKTPSEN